MNSVNVTRLILGAPRNVVLYNQSKTSLIREALGDNKPSTSCSPSQYYINLEKSHEIKEE